LIAAYRGEPAQQLIEDSAVLPTSAEALCGEGYTLMRRYLKYAIPLLAVYVMLLGGLFMEMLGPPAAFGHFMSKLPAATYFLFPFEPMWLLARRGHLKVGDAAPDFALKTTDGSSLVRLSSFRGQKPVVLIFGSHT
jgi:hypothetical protein